MHECSGAQAASAAYSGSSGEDGCTAYPKSQKGISSGLELNTAGCFASQTIVGNRWAFLGSLCFHGAHDLVARNGAEDSSG